jgi:hypothetical protein
MPLVTANSALARQQWLAAKILTVQLEQVEAKQNGPGLVWRPA